MPLIALARSARQVAASYCNLCLLKERLLNFHPKKFEWAGKDT